MKILFFNRNEFTADDYRLEIQNIKTPGSNSNDYLKILFIRYNFKVKTFFSFKL